MQRVRVEPCGIKREFKNLTYMKWVKMVSPMAPELKQVLFRHVIDRKLHPDDNGGSLCCGNDTLRTRRVKAMSLIVMILQDNSFHRVKTA